MFLHRKNSSNAKPTPIVETFCKPLLSIAHGAFCRFFPKSDRIKRQAVGLPAVLLTIAIACTVMVIILMWKYVQGLLGPDQQSDPFGDWKIVVPSLVNTVAIIVFSKIHRKLATTLNDWENYQTQSEYESKLIQKVFFFEFVNNFTGKRFTFSCVLS
jgi:anoctamin-10